MRRRQLVAAAPGLAWWPAALRAQTTERPWRIAFLGAGAAPRQGQFSSFDAIKAGLRERGFAALQTEAWFAEGRIDALPAMAQQVLVWMPDLIVTNLTPAALAAQRATTTIPIVMAGAGDPVAAGLVQSLARPGANITGVAALGPELAAKCLELIHGLRPSPRRIGVLASATDAFTPAMLAAMTPAAERLGMQLLVERVREPAQYEAAFAAWKRQRVEALFVQPSLSTRPAVELALQAGLPSASFVRSFVEQGGLLAYANDLAEVARLVVDMVDRILRGTAPAQLPVQQNTRFDLLINQRTARALGLAVPSTLLLRATEVLE